MIVEQFCFLDAERVPRGINLAKEFSILTVVLSWILLVIAI